MNAKQTQDTIRQMLADWISLTPEQRQEAVENAERLATTKQQQLDKLHSHSKAIGLINF